MEARMNSTRVKCAAIAALLVLSWKADANEWVYGDVTIVEDYSNYGDYQVLVTLTNKVFTVASHASVCTDRFRAVVGLEGMTEEVKKRVFAMMLTAYVTKTRVRLFYSTTGAPNCTIQIASIGDMPA
jgi:hypothetical protein